MVAVRVGENKNPLLLPRSQKSIQLEPLQKYQQCKMTYTLQHNHTGGRSDGICTRKLTSESGQHFIRLFVMKFIQYGQMPSSLLAMY